MTDSSDKHKGPVVDWGGVVVWANNPWTCARVFDVCSCSVCSDYRCAQRRALILSRGRS